MKRFTLAGIAAMALLMVQTATAQVQVGIRVGANWGAVSKPDFADNFSPTFRLSPGPTGAIFLEAPISDRVAFRAEAQYIQKGFVINEDLNFNIGNIPIPFGARVSYQTHYVEVPLLLKVNLNEGPVQAYVLAGGAAGYAVDGRIRTRASGLFRTQNVDIPLNTSSGLFNQWDFSAIGGLGVSGEVGAGRLFLEARYQHGFSRNYDLPVVQMPIRNRGVNVSVGYSFPLSR
ncbi:porin family protein [Tellurirhabdus rosea]|uniref:porin family protein n=1 Tax=Tellurirhabdus rosea TaxID=2674997 RepID=UPI002252BB72|nr:porin family protein [Tellurirhabdus rosea]